MKTANRKIVPVQMTAEGFNEYEGPLEFSNWRDQKGTPRPSLTEAQLNSFDLIAIDHE